jgi:hypothetical protein
MKRKSSFYFALKSVFFVLMFFAEFSSVRSQKTTKSIVPLPSKCSSQKTLNFQSKIDLYLTKIRTYQDRLIRGKTIIELNLLLWECNEINAKQAFLEFWQSLTSEIESAKNQKKNLATNSQEELKELNYLINNNILLKQVLISKLKYLDSTLASQLSKHFTKEEKAYTDFLSIEGFDQNSLSEQQINSIRIALKNIPSSEAISFLYGLRQKNEKIADNLYAELFYNLRNNTQFSFNDLMIIGTYLYRSRFDIYNNHISSYSYNYLPARGILVVDLTSERPDSNKNLRIEYLKLTSRLLSIPGTTNLDKTQRYVFGRIMLNHSYTDAPEISTQMLQALQIHFEGVFESYKDESFYQMLNKINNFSESDSIEKNIEDIEKTTGSNERDDKAIRLANSLYEKGQYEKVEKVADYISDINKKDKLLDITRFSKAQKKIENRENENIEAVIRTINSPSLKALLIIQLLKFSQKPKDFTNDLLLQNVYKAIEYARKSNDEFSPLIILSATKFFSENDNQLNYDLINTVVAKLNSYENWNPPKWYFEIPTLTLSTQKSRFYIKKVDGITILDTISFLLKEKDNNLVDLLLNVKNEKFQSEVILLSAKKTLEESKQKLSEVKK